MSSAGKSSRRSYKVWSGMRSRCEHKSNSSYRYYGAKGITVCDRWQKYDDFIADMGEPPSDKHQIDRIDGTRGYSPDNCRWVTHRENQCNQKSSKLVTINGVTKTFPQWCLDLGLNNKAVSQRVEHGWTREKALTTPFKKYNR